MASDRDLRDIPLFAELDDDALARVADLATTVPVGAGHVLIEAGHAANGLFVLEEGQAVAELPDGSTKELGPGEFFGELALLTDRNRTARVRTVTESTVMALSRGDIMALVESEPKVALAMLRSLADRLAAESET
jgi:CRP-like cAMP-binding protein